MNNQVGSRLRKDRLCIIGYRRAERLLQADYRTQVAPSFAWVAVDAADQLQTALAGGQPRDVTTDRAQAIMDDANCLIGHGFYLPCDRTLCDRKSTAY